MAVSLDEDVHICKNGLEVHRWRGSSVWDLSSKARSGWGAALEISQGEC